MSIENGFYVFNPKNVNDDFNDLLNCLNVPQVIQVIEGVVWISGVELDYSIKEVEEVGVIGKMLFTEDGQIV